MNRSSENARLTVSGLLHVLDVARRLSPAVISIIALVLTAYLGWRSIKLSYRFSSDSEQSIDLVGRKVLDSTPAPPAPYTPPVKDSLLMDLVLSARELARKDSVRAALAQIDAAYGLLRKSDDITLQVVLANTLCLIGVRVADASVLRRALAQANAAESLSRRSSDVFGRTMLGLTLATLGDATRDTSLQRRALSQYDFALGHTDILGGEYTLWVRSLRWWARSKLHELGKLPSDVLRLRSVSIWSVVVCLLVFAFAVLTELAPLFGMGPRRNDMRRDHKATCEGTQAERGLRRRRPPRCTRLLRTRRNPRR